ncbi:lipopolysaccharide biosynthesis protein, partial [Mesorhizobium sp. M7A.T.Ca.TU.009.01.1.2]
MRFSAATTAGRFLPQRWALRMGPLLGRIDAVLFTADERGEASRMSVIAFSIRIVSAVIAFISQVLMARWMGSFEYGIFVLVWVTMVIVGNLACLGFHTSVIRYIPEYRERGLMDELRGIVLASRLFVLIASTLIAGLGALGVWLAAPWIESYYVIPFILGVICLPMIAMSDLLSGLARANSWALFALSPTYLVRPVLILLFMALMLFVGYAPDARTAIFASIAATYVTTLGQLVGVIQRMERQIPAGPIKVHFAQWFVVSLPIFLVESFFFLLTNADVLMVGAYMAV